MSEAAFARWQREAEIHQQAADYGWMASFVPATRVLEIGCGAGFSTAALLAAGCQVLCLEPFEECIAATRSRCEALTTRPQFMHASLATLVASQRDELAQFAPEWIVCWMMGGDDAQLESLSSASSPSSSPSSASAANGSQVQAYRESVHRQACELADALLSVQAIHLVDRSAFPWKIRDSARDTLVMYHSDKTLKGLPFSLARADALYRKLDVGRWSSALQRRGGMTPVLSSVVARQI